MDVVFTFHNWLLGGNVPTESFKDPRWDETVDYVAYAWADHAIRWIEQAKRGTVLFYEKLLGDGAYIELERLLKIHNFVPIDYIRMQCALVHRNNQTDHKQQQLLRYLCSSIE